MAETPRFKPRRQGPSADGSAWASVLASAPWADSAELLKEDGNVRVLAASLRGRSVVLKFYRHSGPRDRVRSRLGAAPADRHWAGAALLAAERIPCAEMLALVSRSGGGVREDCLIMGRLEGQTLLQWLRALRDGQVPIAQQHAVARAVGAQVGCILAAELHNRDHKPSNLIVRFEGDRPVIAVADCQGVKRLEREKSRHTVRMQACLALEPIGTGVLPRRTIIAMTLASAVASYTARRFGKASLDQAMHMSRADRRAILGSLPRGTALAAWPKIAERISIHGDPTPKVNPLGDAEASRS